jgi:hypothetical protein
MTSALDEALEWFNRAEQAREVAGQLTDPEARKAVLNLADSFDRLGRAAVGRCPAAGEEHAEPVAHARAIKRLQRLDQPTTKSYARAKRC